MFFSDEYLSSILEKHPQVPGSSIALIADGNVTAFCAGMARTHFNEPFTREHYLQCASLSKTIAAAFAIDYFYNRSITMDTSVNVLLKACSSTWLITSNDPALNPDNVTLAMLINHTALGMHYVYGIPLTHRTPSALELLDGSCAVQYKYQALFLEREAGQSFSYSGGGFVVLQHLIETMEHAPIDIITKSYLNGCGLDEFTFVQLTGPLTAKYAYGHLNSDIEIQPLAFPPFAAGGLCTPRAFAMLLQKLMQAYHCPIGAGGISHYAARLMLGEHSLIDRGAVDFMGAKVCFCALLVVSSHLICCAVDRLDWVRL
jgi:hypothetical protein